jgi:four helix bundle protein
LEKVTNVMNYDDWLADVPDTIKHDPLWQTAVYRQGLFLGDLAWYDAGKLLQDRRAISVSDQLYRSVGGISATIAEGYGRLSTKDQARYYEYSLGSAREARDWYFKGRQVLGQAVLEHRLNLLAHIIRQLVVMVPKYRGKRIGEASEAYEYVAEDIAKLLQTVPMA